MLDFAVSRLPRLYFSDGALSKLSVLLRAEGARHVALVVGGGAMKRSADLRALPESLETAGMEVEVVPAPSEPSVLTVDEAATAPRRRFGARQLTWVVAIGGGSVLDTGKALSVMLAEDGSVQDYLEGVGTKQPSGRRAGFVAVPTTGGTGSEATKNAVISGEVEAGGTKRGFKKSLRHDNYVPDIAILDPTLALSCPRPATAASGLDAISQLLEAFVSTRSNPFTDAVTEEGLRQAGMSYMRAVQAGAQDLGARAGMAFAAYASGLGIANAGLGLVHGIAGPLCGAHPVPHGVGCAALVAGVTRAAVATAIRLDDPTDRSALKKYARAGIALAGRDAGSDIGNAALLVATLDTFAEAAGLPRLGAFGVDEDAAAALARICDARTHPVPVTVEEVRNVIIRSI